jgi:hypothetical protein
MASIGEQGVLRTKAIIGRAAALLAVALLFDACGSTGHDTTITTPAAPPADGARQQCEGAATDQANSRGHVDGLTAAFASTAARVAAWQERWAAADGKADAVSQWRDYPADEAVTVCYFDGVFVAPRPPGVADDKGPPERYVVVVGGDGVPVPFVVGHRSNVPVQAPA